MRWFITLLGLTALATAQETTSLDDARVQLSYKELKSLIAAAAAKDAPPPVESAVLSARYDLTLGEKSAAGVAEFEVQTFRDGPHAISLAGDSLIIESIEPKDALLVMRDGRYALALEGRQRAKVRLRFTTPVKKSGDGLSLEWPVNPAVSTLVNISGIPKGRHVTVENGVPEETIPQSAVHDPQSPAAWRLGRAATLHVTMGDAPAVLPPPVTMPAIVREAASEMRVVTDGAYFNKMTWRIRHQAPLIWRLDLPEANQLVSARVAGRPVSPSRVDAKTIEFRLPEPSTADETVVEISYTGKGAAFDPVRGELAASLPATPLLVESLAWQIAIPAAYETVAAQGNVEFLPGNSPGEIRLSKELCQGEAPAVRLFYQKPETKKP